MALRASFNQAPFLWLLLISGPCEPVAAQTGELDPAFGDDGVFLADIGLPLGAVSASMVVRNDGVILVAGGSRILAVAPDGEGVADSFGNAGLVDSVATTTTDMVVLPDNRILVVGGGQGGFLVACYLPDGTLDPTFGEQGIAIVPMGGLSSTRCALALQSDGKLLIVGTSFNFDQGLNCMALARMNADGTADGTFGTGGYVLTTFPGMNALGFAVAQLLDGRAVIAGVAASGGTTYMAMACIDQIGAVDMNFGDEGMVLSDFGFDGAYVVDLAVQADGRLLVIGPCQIENGDGFMLAGFTPDGALDPTFSDDGLVFHVDDLILREATDVLVQSDGRIVVAVNETPYPIQDERHMVYRYLSDGAEDAIWSGDGVVTTDLEGDNSCGAMALQPDGAVVVAGQWQDARLVVRYQNDSPTTLAEAPGMRTGLSCDPNPVVTQATITFSLAQEELGMLELFDVSGRSLRTIPNDIRLSRRTGEVIIDMSGFEAGVYPLLLYTSTERHCLKVIKQ